MSPSKSNTCKVLPTRLPEHELTNEDTYRHAKHAKMDGRNDNEASIIYKEKKKQPYGKLRNADCGRNGLLQGRTHQLSVQYQMVIHTSKIIWTKQVIFRILYAYTYACIHVITSNEKEAAKEEGGI